MRINGFWMPFDQRSKWYSHKHIFLTVAQVNIIHQVNVLHKMPLKRINTQEQPSWKRGRESREQTNCMYDWLELGNSQHLKARHILLSIPSTNALCSLWSRALNISELLKRQCLQNTGSIREGTRDESVPKTRPTTAVRNSGQGWSHTRMNLHKI